LKKGGKIDHLNKTYFQEIQEIRIIFTVGISNFVQGMPQKPTSTPQVEPMRNWTRHRWFLLDFFSNVGFVSMRLHPVGQKNQLKLACQLKGQNP
jgi:hypothetical protein